MQEIREEISLKEAMELAGVVQKTIYNWCKDRKFLYRRAFNRRLWIDKESFIEYLGELGKAYNE